MKSVKISISERKKPEDLVLIYVGPTIPTLPRRTILGRRRPKHVQELIRQCPDLDCLIVPLSAMREIEAFMQFRGSGAHSAAHAVTQAFKR